MIANAKVKYRLSLGACVAVLGLALLLPLTFVHGQQEGNRGEKAEPQKRDGGRKDGEGDRPGIRGTVQKIDVKQGTLTVVHRGDGGTTVHKLNLAGKNIKITGTAKKLTDLKPGVSVVVELSEVNDVTAIHVTRPQRRSPIGRIFKAYDKDGNDKVNFVEWKGMKEGKFNQARTELEQRRFNAVDTNRDGVLSFEEFQNWRNPNRPPQREGDGRRQGDGAPRRDG